MCCCIRITEVGRPAARRPGGPAARRRALAPFSADRPTGRAARADNRIDRPGPGRHGPLGWPASDQPPRAARCPRLVEAVAGPTDTPGRVQGNLVALHA